MPANLPFPPEVIVEIAKNIPRIADLSAFTRTCRQTYAAATSTLFHAACSLRKVDAELDSGLGLTLCSRGTGRWLVCDAANVELMFGAAAMDGPMDWTDNVPTHISAAQYYLSRAAHAGDIATLARLLDVFWPVHLVAFGGFPPLPAFLVQPVP